MKTRRWDPHTLVLTGTMDPVLPCDCNPGTGDEGMLVYRTKRAATAAAKHQMETFQVRCRAVPLSSVIAHESNIAGKIKPALPRADKKKELNRRAGI